MRTVKFWENVKGKRKIVGKKNKGNRKKKRVGKKTNV